MVVLRAAIKITGLTGKRTRARLFKDTKVGDTLQLAIPIREAGSNSGGTHASYITICNFDSGDCTYKSFNELGNKLDEYFTYEEAPVAII